MNRNFLDIFYSICYCYRGTYFFHYRDINKIVTYICYLRIDHIIFYFQFFISMNFI